MGGTRVDLFKPGTTRPSGTAYLYDSEDISTAKKLLVMNAGGIAFYNNGFNVDDPSSSVPAFVVMDNQGRVNAAAILVGILTAIKIQSADGESFWDLSTGSMEMKGNFKTVAGSLSAEAWGGVFSMKRAGKEWVGISTSATDDRNGSGFVQVREYLAGQDTGKLTQIIGSEIRTDRVFVGAGANRASLQASGAIELRSDTYGVQIGKYSADLRNANWVYMTDKNGTSYRVLADIG